MRINRECRFFEWHPGALIAPLLACCLLFLSGCGYQVRTAELDSLGFRSVELQCDKSKAWDLCKGLERELRAHSVNITEQSEFLLSVSGINSVERVFTINNDATADEFEITRSLNFTLKEKANEASSYTNEVSARRIYRHNSNALLAKDREKATITKALDTSLAYEVIRQLTLIRIGN